MNRKSSWETRTGVHSMLGSYSEGRCNALCLLCVYTVHTLWRNSLTRFIRISWIFSSFFSLSSFSVLIAEFRLLAVSWQLRRWENRIWYQFYLSLFRFSLVEFVCATWTFRKYMNSTYMWIYCACDIHVHKRWLVIKMISVLDLSFPLYKKSWNAWHQTYIFGTNHFNSEYISAYDFYLPMISFGFLRSLANSLIQVSISVDHFIRNGTEN